ncbi:Beta-propeller repeat-containing protein [Stigmatella erecta]|uniref:Beta-propeller repeat-containing protein n=1 Tax=Stigmatella erecta TaxID=83460 RepID=A0A1I0L6U3_9BACT|nr:Beta-propeller repeat-containing protein [Stigmatella erecta]
MTYSTYLGFGESDKGLAVAVDPSGNAYVLGNTNSFGSTSNIFVAKMSPTGQNIYFTYFPGRAGADADTSGADIAVDNSGNAYIVARTSNGSLVAKLNSSGSAFTYYITVPWLLKGITVDSLGNAYVTGQYDGGTARVAEVLISKLNPSGSAFVYSITFGGTQADWVEDIAVDSSGNAYVAGWTYSFDFPVVNPVQATNPGWYAAFVTKLSATGTTLSYSTYLGSQNGHTFASGIALDGARNAYITGHTTANFPVTPGAAQTSFGGGGLDGYVTKLNATGGLAYSTYLGGSADEWLMGRGSTIAVDSNSGTAYVTGLTNSSNFPLSYTAFQSTNHGNSDAFVTQVGPQGNTFWSSYLGGSMSDDGWGIALDSSMNVYVTGRTNSSDFPTNVYGYGGNDDAFITKFNGL